MVKDDPVASRTLTDGDGAHGGTKQGINLFDLETQLRRVYNHPGMLALHEHKMHGVASCEGAGTSFGGVGSDGEAGADAEGEEGAVGAVGG